MKNRNIIKIIIDIIMTIIMITLMNLKLFGIKTHEILGITVLIIFIIHKLLNLKMIKSSFKNLLNNKLKKRFKVSFILDIILFLFMIGVIITGILISNYLFKDLFIGNIGVIKKIHKFLSWWFLVLISVHFGFHLYILTDYIKNKFLTTIFIIIYLLISLNGIKVIAVENIYRNFIPNFTVNHYGKTENDKQYNGKDSNERNYRNRKNKEINENRGNHMNSINLFDISSIFILFAGTTHVILKILNDKEKAT